MHRVYQGRSHDAMPYGEAPGERGNPGGDWGSLCASERWLVRRWLALHLQAVLPAPAYFQQVRIPTRSPKSSGDVPTDWIVFRVTDVTTPKFDANSPDAKRIEDTVKRQESEEIYTQYVAWLQNDLGTTVNQAALAQALGSSGPDTN
jgi:hypothetical protein